MPERLQMSKKSALPQHSLTKKTQPTASGSHRDASLRNSETVPQHPRYTLLAFSLDSFTIPCHSHLHYVQFNGLLWNQIQNHIMNRYILSTAALLAWAAATTQAQDCGLFFSEYAEGSSYNKYVEVYNPTGANVDLDGISIEIYMNGSATASQSMSLSGMLAAGEVALYAHPSANPTILALATATSGSVINWNGNDAVLLRGASGEVLDVIGEIGSSSNYAVADADTKDNTLVRKPEIGQGTADWASAAGTDAATSQWIALANEDWTQAGAHTSTATCDAAPAGDFTLRILHNNDGESSLLTVDHFAATVQAERAASAAEGVPSILLSSGDNFLAGSIFTLSQNTGTYYDAMALDRLGYDALCLGNHDFDFGPAVLAEFIEAYTLTAPPYLSANLDFSTEPALAGLAAAGRILPSTVLNVDGQQVAVIGLTTPLLNGISSPGLVGINNDIVSVVQSEVDAYEAAGINKIILISHLQSVTNDMNLAAAVTGVDLIIAGGGDQLLTNSLFDTDYEVYGSYPLTTTDAEGATTYVVTTIGNYRFLGSLKMTFDADGNVTSVHSDESDVIAVDISEGAPSDADMYATVVAPLEAALSQTQVVATSEIAFDVRKNIIRSREAGIGNVIADAYLSKAREWALMEGHDMPQIGFANGGGIRSNMVYPAGEITDQDAGNILPFPNYISVIEDVPSDVLKLVFENAYSQVTLDENGELVGDDGRFAHIADATVVYDIAGEAYVHDAAGAPVVTGSRIVSLVLGDGTVVVENGAAVEGVTVDVASVDFSLNGGDFYPFDLAGSPVLVSEFAALDAFIDFLSTDLGGLVTAAAYPENPGMAAGRIQVVTPVCDDPTACTYNANTFCFYADDCGVCNGDGSSCIEGCTNELACNYYDLAVIDDGSCIVPTPGNPCPTTVSVTVSNGTDDAEEQLDPANPYYSGFPYMTSSDLELTFDGGDQEVGIRFASLNVPAGVTISEAYIQFTADASHDGETNLFVHVENSTNPVTYSDAVQFDVSDREKFQLPVEWANVPAWTAGLAGMDQRTPDLTALVQHIIDLDGWAAGNPINFIVTGTGRREAESFENDEADASLAPTLVVSYQELSGEGCTDAEASNYDPAAVIDNGTCTYEVVFAVSAGTDDVEETLNEDAQYFANGLPYMDSSDLELVQDGDANQAVGVRFTGLNIQPGQTIASAYIQFATDEVSTGPAAIEVAIQDAGNTETFDASVAYDVSGRTTVGASVSWDVPEWLVVGEAGEAQRTPDLAALLQAVVNRADWAPYNAVTFLLTGEGTRTAEAFEGSAALAPRLVVEVLGTPALSLGCTDPAAANYDASAGVDDGSCTYLVAATIAEIQQGQLTGDFTGTPVTTSGVVTYVKGSFFILQDGTGAYSAISAFSSGHGLSVGDDVTVTASVTEYNGLTELISFTDITLNGTAALPAAEVLGTGELNDEQWESVLVGTTGAVSGLSNNYGEWLINDGTGDVQVDDYDLAVPSDLALGQTYYVEGPLTFSFGAFELRALVQELQVELAGCQLGVVYVSEAHTSGEPEDYIELYNSGSEDCSLAGFQLDDNTALEDLTFGDVVIAAGGYWLGYEDAPGSFTSGLSSGGDIVVLADPQGNTLIVEAGPSIGDLSKSYDAEGNGCYTLPTPGAANDACGVVGCMDATACNYDEAAVADDGSCTFSDGILDCAGACINDADGDGVCDENEALEGCTDPTAENYNAQANVDDGSCWTSDLAFELMATHSTGQFDAGAAEIVDYHAGSQRLFYVNASARTVDALDMSDPSNLTLAFTFDATAYGASANGLVVFGDHVAVAIEGNAIDEAGQIVIIDTDGNFVSSAPAGYLPDAVTISHDGMTIAVANEGQPSEDYTYDPVGSTTLIDVTNPASPVATQVSFAGITEAMLDESVRIFGPNASIEQDLEPEYSAFSGDDSKVFVSCQENNCIITIDVATGQVEDIWGLGFKDHMLAGNGLDASNQDGTINIANWPVKGMYMPDAIHSYEVAGQTYIVAANEGDSRDYSGYSEEARVKDVVLDPTAFPNAAELQANENLGRLLITTSMGDTDGDGDFDELYSYGGRSFTIYTAEGDLVYDSGDDFEQTLAQLFPNDFNSTNSGNGSFDNRSDDKGPEPEGIDLGTINGRTYAFIGLERMSGVMVYDITDPSAPVYQRYLSNRDFTVANSALQLDAGAAGDLGPEGLVFIPGANSPDGQDYLVTSNEISGTVTAYALTSSVEAPEVAVCQLGVVYVSEAHTSGEPEDYIELFNSGSEDCSLAGFQLDDNTALTDLTFGDVVIAAGGYWIGYEDAEGSFGSGLSSGGDIVVLGNGLGDQLVVTLGGSIGGYSQSFDADGNGCYTDPTPGADNGACKETQLITVDDLGCTYEGACNFDATALFDDGSCVYLPGDLTGNGSVDMLDLLDFLASFTSTCSDVGF